MAEMPKYGVVITGPLPIKEADRVALETDGSVIEIQFHPSFRAPDGDSVKQLSSTNLNAASREINDWATAKGWNERPASFVESMMLIVTEAAEATEEFRNGHELGETYYTHAADCALGSIAQCTCTPKMEGIPSELADIIIRVCHVAGFHGIDLDEAIRIKRTFNETRPARHGGKAL